MLRKNTWLVLQVVFLLILVGCGVGKESKVSASEELINTKKELYQKVEQGLKNGQTEISFETNELGKEDFDTLNKEHDGFYGNVTRYRIRSVELLNKSYVTLYCEIYDNYYVENAILHGKQIPEDREDAQKLFEVCKKLLPKIGGEKVSDYRKEKRIHDYLVQHIEYGFSDKDDEASSKAYSSYGALVEKKAVCNGYAQAMKLLCDLTGVECEMISGTADGENHAWNLVKLDDSWYHVDATWDDPTPDDPARVFYHYFNVDDEFISGDHSWDSEAFRTADGGEYNYFVLNELICNDFSDFRDKCGKVFEKESPKIFQMQVRDYDKDTYSETNLQFLFSLSGASSLNMQTVGKNPYVTLYFTLSYD